MSEEIKAPLQKVPREPMIATIDLLMTSTGGGAAANDGPRGRREKAKCEDREQTAHISVQADWCKLSIPRLFSNHPAIPPSKLVRKRSVCHDRDKDIPQFKGKARPAAVKKGGSYLIVQEWSEKSPRHDEIKRAVDGFASGNALL